MRRHGELSGSLTMSTDRVAAALPHHVPAVGFQQTKQFTGRHRRIYTTSISDLVFLHSGSRESVVVSNNHTQENRQHWTTHRARWLWATGAPRLARPGVPDSGGRRDEHSEARSRDVRGYHRHPHWGTPGSGPEPERRDSMESRPAGPDPTGSLEWTALVIDVAYRDVRRHQLHREDIHSISGARPRLTWRLGGRGSLAGGARRAVSTLPFSTGHLRQHRGRAASRHTAGTCQAGAGDWPAGRATDPGVANERRLAGCNHAASLLRPAAVSGPLAAHAAGQQLRDIHFLPQCDPVRAVNEHTVSSASAADRDERAVREGLQ